MAMLHSAGIALFRVNSDSVLELFIGHPGGTFFAKKDDAVWSFPKGEIGKVADGLAEAKREFEEEIGVKPPEGPEIYLGDKVLYAGKTGYIWAIETTEDVKFVESNLIEIEWPPRSQKKIKIPEIDRAEWANAASARRLLNKGLVEYIDRLIAELSKRGTKVEEGTDIKSQQATLF